MITTSTRLAEAALSRHQIAAGDYFIGRIECGQTLRLVDLEGNQAADTLFYNAEDPSERYSAMDTLREQGNIYLTSGSVLRSNLNRPMLEIVADTCGRHDTLGGACATESNTVRYDLEKRCMHACRDSWMLAITEHPEYGIQKRDISHNVNFFYECACDTRRWTQFCRRYFSGRKICRNDGKNGFGGTCLQLPTTEQSMQWL